MTRQRAVKFCGSVGENGWMQLATHVTGLGRRVFPKLPFENALLLSWGQ